MIHLTEGQVYPTWQPVPRRPWRLSTHESDWLRDEQRVALRFETAEEAINWAELHGYEVPTMLGRREA